jgi:protein-tyrosine kinase
MSRIQDILSKAERDGTARRTRGLSPEGRAAAATAPPPLDSTPPPPPAWMPEPGPAAFGAEEARRAPVSRLDPSLIAATASHSLAAEQYRALRTRIKRAENGRALRAIAITSPGKGDGKSLTAANLALTMAQEFQQRVLLVDGDLRRPSVHRLFGVSDGPGLSDVLMGGAEMDEAIQTLADYNLAILPAGTPPGHPAELLGSAAMRRLLDALRTRYDRIIIDLPPVAPLADLHIVAPLADGVLMIVRAGVTPKPAIERALSGLESGKVLGLVLNDAGDRAADRHTYEGYGYIAG